MQANNIISNTGYLVELPYAFPETMQPLTIEYDEIIEGVESNVYAVRGNKRKKIASFFPPGNFTKIEATFVVKSPFENRLLIITQVSAEHMEFDFTFNSFYYSGCHITDGF